MRPKCVLGQLRKGAASRFTLRADRPKLLDHAAVRLDQCFQLPNNLAGVGVTAAGPVRHHPDCLAAVLGMAVGARLDIETGRFERTLTRGRFLRVAEKTSASKSRFVVSSTSSMHMSPRAGFANSP